jgi:hypothetical protein
MFNKKGQNVVEYSILIALVVGAAIAMQTYVKRGLQGRVKDSVDFVGNMTTSGGGEVVNLTGRQYEPYYTETVATINSTRSVAEDTDLNGLVNRTAVDEGSIRMQGAYDTAKNTSHRNDTSAN